MLPEPSGRLTAAEPRGLDRAYPRGIVRDLPGAIGRPDLAGALGLTSPLRYRADAPNEEFKPSEWVAPWRYPLTNQGGAGVAQEGAETHAGPYVVGARSTILLSGLVGDDGARASLEKAGSPAETLAALDLHLARGEDATPLHDGDDLRRPCRPRRGRDRAGDRARDRDRDRDRDRAGDRTRDADRAAGATFRAHGAAPRRSAEMR